jgi:hypothetical protein
MCFIYEVTEMNMWQLITWSVAAAANMTVRVSGETKSIYRCLLHRRAAQVMQSFNMLILNKLQQQQKRHAFHSHL